MDNNKCLFRRQFILGPHFINNLPEWKMVKYDEKYFLTVHPELEVSKATFDKNIFVLIGYIIDPFNPSFSNQEIIKNIAEKISVTDDMFKCLDSMCGRFVIIAKINDELIIFNDAGGYRQIYYYSDENNNLWCGSQPSIIAEQFKFEKDRDITNDLIKIPLIEDEISRWFPGNITLYKDIYHLTPNHYLELNSGEAKRYWPTQKLKPISIEEAVESSSKILQGAFKGASLRYNLGLAVTAGYDSRVLLAACRMVKDKISFFTHTHNDLDENGIDIQIPKKLLQKIGQKHNLFRHSNEIDDDFKTIFNRNVTGAKESALRNAYAFYNYFIKIGKEMVVTYGEAGGLGKSYYRLPSFFPVNEKALATLTGMRGSRIAEQAFGEWWKSAKKAADCGMKMTDLLYWEMRLGNWSTFAISSYDIVFESFLPFNCRKIMQCFISVDKKYRLPPNYTHVYLVKNMWPELLELPINPPSGKKEEIKSKIKGTKLYGTIRFLKFIFRYLLGYS